MPRPLTQKSYRGVAKGLITSFNRLGEHGPWNRQKGVTANEIGNAFYAFGDPEARHWFETALVWYRRGGITDPWTGIAYLHWKLGNQEACTEECRRIIEYNGRKLEEKKSQGLEGVRLFREYDETAVAHFLLGDYETALRRVEEAAGLGIEGGISSHLYALRDMAEGVLQRTVRFSRRDRRSPGKVWCSGPGRRATRARRPSCIGTRWISQGLFGRRNEACPEHRRVHIANSRKHRPVCGCRLQAARGGRRPRLTARHLSGGHCACLANEREQARARPRRRAPADWRWP